MYPLDDVSPEKLEKLQAEAEEYMEDLRLSDDDYWVDERFDNYADDL